MVANYSAELGVIVGQMDVTEYPGKCQASGVCNCHSGLWRI